MNSIENPNPSKQEKIPKVESTRSYEASPAILEIRFFTSGGKVYDKKITPDTKVCLIGDGQGMDTDQFLKMHVNPENIHSINYEQSEVDHANKEGVLKDKKVKMKQGDATKIDDLLKTGVERGSQDVVTLMHVLEVPNIKGEVEKKLVENVVAILKPDGELLVSQYKHKFTKEERKLQEQIGIEEIKAEDLQKRFGDNWKQGFKEEYGTDWEEGMRYGEVSNIRSKEELEKLFGEYFDIKLEETEREYVLKMKKKEQN